eukprot:63155-Prymnesium_polylepis.2
MARRSHGGHANYLLCGASVGLYWIWILMCMRCGERSPVARSRSEHRRRLVVQQNYVDDRHQQARAVLQRLAHQLRPGVCPATGDVR